MVRATGQRSAVYAAGDARAVVSTPEREGCRADRYLRRHPDGVGSLSFQVEDLDRAWRFLDERKATFIHDIRETRHPSGGRYRHFSITTAIGDVAFRFCEKCDFPAFAPGFEPWPDGEPPPEGGVAYQGVDHITSNAVSLMPVVLWMEHVLGMEECWRIDFHTKEYMRREGAGTGLRSIVMWDPRSGLKFPTNEPLQPYFKEGQINAFVEDNWGAGIQHIALGVDEIVPAVRTLRNREARFLPTPDNYYEHAPSRLAERGIDVGTVEHDWDELRELGILIDGSPPDRYLVQIFTQDLAGQSGEEAAGPFFYELIERCGDPGFGEGNFKALFEAIEREQGIE